MRPYRVSSTLSEVSELIGEDRRVSEGDVHAIGEDRSDQRGSKLIRERRNGRIDRVLSARQRRKVIPMRYSGR